MKKKSLIALLLVLSMLVCGCGNGGDTDETTDSAHLGSSADVETNANTSTDDYFSNRDFKTDYDIDQENIIYLNDTGVSCASGNVSINGTTVTITGEGNYLLTGALSDGMIIVDADSKDKIQLVLDGVTINSATSAPIYVRQADKVFLTTAEGSENTLSNGGSFEAIDENNIDAVVFAKDDLTMNGEGSLTVTSPAGHGIVSKDSLTITGGTYEITTASHGMTANDDVCISGAAVKITAGKDGIQAENDEDTSLGYVYVNSGELNISAEGDGISATAYILVDGGTFDITCGGGYENGSSASSGNYGGFGGGMGGMGGMGRPGQGSSSSSSSGDDSTSMKGIKADGEITINGGTFEFDTADDSIHSNTNVTVNGGVIQIASGDDGIHAEDTLTVTECTMAVVEAYEGLEAANIYIQGGEMYLNCSDDGLNASGGTDSSGMGNRDGMFGGGGMMKSSYGNIEITGGKLTIYSTGDAIDSNGDMTMTGGYVYATNPGSGDVSVLDSQNAPVITGGTYIGLGISTMMAETFSSASAQGVIACTCGNQPAGSALTITDSSGKEILSMTTEYSTSIMIISTPDVVKGESYTITIGSVSGTISAN